MESPKEPITQPLPQRQNGQGRILPREFDADEGQVVDLFDAAARIESRGYSDRSLFTRYGYDSVFALAGEIADRGPLHRTPEEVTPVAYSVIRAWMRAALLVSGAVLAGLVQAQLGAGSLEMIVAGCAGWVLGQAVAGVTWYRLRFDSKDRAARYGGVVAVACAVLALAAAGALVLTGQLGAPGFYLILGWVAYALAVSLLAVLDRITLPLTVMSVAVVVQLTAWLAVPQGNEATGLFTVLPAIAAVTVIVLYTVYTVRSGEDADQTDLAEIRGIAVPVTQAVLLSGALVIALSVVPDSHGTAFVATAVLMVAITDPGIVVLRRRLSWFAHRSSSLLWSRRFAWGLASFAILSVALLAAGLVVLIVAVTGAEEERLTSTVLGSVLFTVLATLSSVLTAFGAQVKGLVPALLAVLVMVVVAAMTGGLVLAVSALAIAVGLALLIHQFSDARVFT